MGEREEGGVTDDTVYIARMLEKPPKFVAWEAEEITSLFMMEENDG